MSGTRSRFPGAHSFGDDDLSRALFQGRAEESAALAHQIVANRLVVLFARSGVGKTSLLAAGVAELLRQERFVPLTARVNDIAAGAVASVLRSIDGACRAQGVECADAEREGGLWRFFRTATFWRDDVLLCPVLVLDQFEELFTLYPGPERAALVDDLSCLVRGVPPRRTVGADAAPLDESPPRLRIVLSLREDFLAHLEELSDRVPGLMESRFRLLPLTRAQASDAITRPLSIEDPSLSTLPFAIHPDARKAVLDFLESEAPAGGAWTAPCIEPFQLQVVCQYLEGLALGRQGRTLAPSTIQINEAEVGGPYQLRHVVRCFYESQLAAIASWRQRRRARRLCSEHLISPQGRRLRMEETEIWRLARTRTATLGVLVGRRILRVDPSAGASYYELSHDSLVGPIVEAGGVGLVMRALLLLALVLSGAGVALGLTLLLSTLILHPEMLLSVEAFLIVPLLASILAIFWRGAVNDVRSLRAIWQRLFSLRSRLRRRIGRKPATA